MRKTLLEAYTDIIIEEKEAIICEVKYSDKAKKFKKRLKEKAKKALSKEKLKERGKKAVGKHKSFWKSAWD